MKPHWLALLLLLPFPAIAQEPQPLLRYRFDEGTGVAKNSGRIAPAGDLTFGADAGFSADHFGVSGAAGDFAYKARPYNEWEALSPTEECFATATGQNDIRTKLDELKAFTVTGWINAPVKFWSGEDGGGRTVLSFGGGYDKGVSIVLQSGGEIAVKEKDFTLARSSTEGGIYDSTAKKDDPEAETGWVFFAVTWDGKGDKSIDKIKFYYGTRTVPAKLVSSQTRTGEGETNTGEAGPFRIGNADAPGSHYEAFCGLLDDIRIYTIVLPEKSIERVRTAAVRKSLLD